MGPSHYHVMLDVLRPKDRARRQNSCWTDHAALAAARTPWYRRVAARWPHWRPS